MQGLYIHIPFCVSKCAYCDFASFANIKRLRLPYLKALKREIILQKKYYKNFNPKTLYIGGGTPSFLTSAQIKFLFNSIYGCYKNFKEITFEANPESLTLSKIRLLKSLGVNRLSLGLQSTFDKHLKTLGRAHNFETFLRAYTQAKKYFDNINVDLIAGLPNQTLAEFEQSVNLLISLKPQHISVYGLQVEEGTPLYKRGYVCDDNLTRKMLESAENILCGSGFVHYEISNFSLPKYKSKHNINYWLAGDYLGCGSAAASYMQGVRFQNTADIKEYIKSLAKSKIPTVFEENLQGKAKVGEEILLKFRLLNGFKPTQKMLKYFGKEFKILLDKKLIIQDGKFLKLSEEGKYFANAVFRYFVEPF
ncbi:MAG: radical SAM family heme chaperone HemW [Elusimicrobiaceae bacterium]|nr:radical SAM family heme chaperone HemW [Elusimicrobiaceae bacterium]